MATLLVLLVVAGYAVVKRDSIGGHPWRTNDEPKVVIYEVSSSELGVMADIQFFDGNSMVSKEDIVLPATYEVVLEKGEAALVVAEAIRNFPRKGSLFCDLLIQGFDAGGDEQSLDSMYPEVECSMIV
jgi:hypothetical protein